VAKDINTNSKEWCDLVFEGRNKSYGAYKMRLTSAKRHILAFIIVILSTAFIVSIPTLIEMIKFYVFQHYTSDYVIEDYKYITDNLTEVELMQLTKQFIPNPSKTKKKHTSSNEQIQNYQDFKTNIPEIVEDSLINDTNQEYDQKDSVTVEPEIKNMEEDKETETDDGLYLIVDEMPAFPGGEPGLMDYIYKNLRYPYTAASKKIENCVICTFIIDIDGSVKQAEIVQSAHPLLDKEALRIVKSLPKWKPAKQHGKPIRVKYTLPIIFRLK